jgi:hypothetical protein
MAKAQDPPSPIDAYGPPPPPIPAGTPMPPQYSATAPQYAQPIYGAQPRATNVLAIIALIASCAGVVVPLAYIAGIVMGFIALSQIKRTGEGGHGLALAAVIVGFAVLVIEFALVALYLVFIFWIVGTAVSTTSDYGNFG